MASLVCGICAVAYSPYYIGLLPGLTAILLFVILRRRRVVSSLATTGLVCGIVGAAYSALMIVGCVTLALGRAQFASARPYVPRAYIPPPQTAPVPEVLDLSHRITERNEIFVRYSWKVVLYNSAARPVDADLHIQFTDADGYVLHREFDSTVSLLAMANATCTGFCLVPPPLARQAKNIVARVSNPEYGK